MDKEQILERLQDGMIWIGAELTNEEIRAFLLQVESAFVYSDVQSEIDNLDRYFTEKAMRQMAEFTSLAKTEKWLVPIITSSLFKNNFDLETVIENNDIVEVLAIQRQGVANLVLQCANKFLNSTTENLISFIHVERELGKKKEVVAEPESEQERLQRAMCEHLSQKGLIQKTEELPFEIFQTPRMKEPLTHYVGTQRELQAIINAGLSETFATDYGIDLEELVDTKALAREVSEIREAKTGEWLEKLTVLDDFEYFGNQRRGYHEKIVSLDAQHALLLEVDTTAQVEDWETLDTAPWKLSLFQLGNVEKSIELRAGESLETFEVQETLEQVLAVLSGELSREAFLAQLEEKKSIEKEGREYTHSSLGLEIPEGTVLPDSETAVSFVRPSVPHYTTKNEFSPRVMRGFESISTTDLDLLNEKRELLAKTADFYAENIANHKIHYVFQGEDGLQSLSVEFNEANFAHFVGLGFDRKNATEFLQDILDENYEQNDIFVKKDGTTFDKLAVLEKFSDLFTADSLLLNDLSTVKQAQRLNFSEAINTEDEQLLLAIREIDGEEKVPVSLLNLSRAVNANKYAQVPRNQVLAVYSEHMDGTSLNMLSANKQYMQSEELRTLSLGLLNASVENDASEFEAQRNRELDEQVEVLWEQLAQAGELHFGDDGNNFQTVQVAENVEIRLDIYFKGDNTEDFEDTTTAWQLSSEALGGVIAYGEDWANNFPIGYELREILTNIDNLENARLSIYPAEEVDAFLKEVFSEEQAEKTRDHKEIREFLESTRPLVIGRLASIDHRKDNISKLIIDDIDYRLFEEWLEGGGDLDFFQETSFREHILFLHEGETKILENSFSSIYEQVLESLNDYTYKEIQESSLLELKYLAGYNHGEISSEFQTVVVQEIERFRQEEVAKKQELVVEAEQAITFSMKEAFEFAKRELALSDDYIVLEDQWKGVQLVKQSLDGILNTLQVSTDAYQLKFSPVIDTEDFTPEAFTKSIETYRQTVEQEKTMVQVQDITQDTRNLRVPAQEHQEESIKEFAQGNLFNTNEEIVLDGVVSETQNGITKIVFEPSKFQTGEKKEMVVTQTEATDFVFPEDLESFYPTGERAKIQANIAAIRLVKELEANKTQATSEQQAVLARYIGWGGLSKIFDERLSKYTDEREELKALVTNDEYRSMERSVLTAYYTDPMIIKEMYKGLQEAGFTGGRILEPSLGTGNFFSSMPKELRANSELHGVELDSLTGAIAKHLHPNANIQIQGFETTNYPDNRFDLVIGNVPFADLKIKDPNYDRKYYIHDYFIKKSLDLVRDGGVVAVITSNGTMDKVSKKFRKELAEEANLLGAFRLPNNAFTKIAGTNATTDILFFQKDASAWEDIEFRNNKFPTWVDSVENVLFPEMPYNLYFQEHPQNILGSIKALNFQGKTLTVTPEESLPLKESLERRLTEVLSETRYEATMDLAELEKIEVLMGEILGSSADLPITTDEIAIYSYKQKDGKYYYRDDEGIQQMDLSGMTLKRVNGMLEIRETVHALIALQLEEDYSAEEYERLRLTLNDQYDRFVARYGAISNQPNKTAFKLDDSYELLCSMELPEERGIDGEEEKTETVYHKGQIFFEPTVRPFAIVKEVKTAMEALYASLNAYGEVNLDYMREIYPRSEQQLVEELDGQLFATPNGYHYAPYYLSGDVRAKLEKARTWVARGETHYLANVEALEAIQPEHLPLENIDYTLGTTWIPYEMYYQYLASKLARYSGDLGPHELSLNREGKWDIRYEKRYTNHSFEERFGTKDLRALQVFQDTLNQSTVEVKDTEKLENGKTRNVLNGPATILAQEKQELLKNDFKQWVSNDPQRREHLETLYNQKFNRIVKREYDGQHLTFDGLNQTIELRPHQKNAVARILSERRGLLAHVVGSGKTLTMIASAMKLKETGGIQKPLFVVPKHLVGEFGREILRAYPNKKVLIAGENDFSETNRKKYMAKIATGNYDAIVCAHSQFQLVPMSKEYQTEFLENQLESMIQQIQESKFTDKQSWSYKEQIKRKEQLEKKLEALANEDRKDTFIDFESLGVDMLFVDEAHIYKNLPFATKHNNIAGINANSSQRAIDMLQKVRYLQKKHAGKGAVFATGTPISNSMAEMFTMMNFLQPDVLEQADIEYFDKWASVFGVIENSVEVNLTSNNYKKKQRFARFNNLPELMNLFTNVTDIQTADMLNLPTPSFTRHIVVSEMTMAQKRYMESLIERAEAIEMRSVDPEEDNMLKLCGDASKLAIDPRLLDSHIFESGDSLKVEHCLENVLEIWATSKDIRATQIVFSDSGVPNDKKDFDLYNAMKGELLERGVPEKEIAFIHDATNDKKKAALFAKVRDGHVRVLFGSTERLGTGTNVQDRLLAVHHLDVPWRPSDLEQRDGRIVRQGNQNEHVHIYNYVTKGSFDSYRWQVLEQKLKYITQVMSNKNDARSIEDVDEAVIEASEVKAVATGNPLLRERADLENEVNRLRLLKTTHGQEKNNAHREIKTIEKQLEEMSEEVQHLEKDSERLRETTLDHKDIFVSGTHFETREEAGEALITRFKQAYKGEINRQAVLAEIHGFQLRQAGINTSQEGMIRISSKEMDYPLVAFQADKPSGITTRLMNAFNKIKSGIHLEKAKEKIEDCLQKIDAMENRLKRSFDHEEELLEKEFKLNEYNQAISMNLTIDEFHALKEKDEPKEAQQEEKGCRLAQEM